MKRLLKSKWREVFEIEYFGIISFLILWVFVNFPDVLSLGGIELNSVFFPPDRYVLESRDSVAAGNYYLSLGRPKGSCTLLKNSGVVTSNRSPISKTRDSLGIGAVIFLDHTQPLNLELVCLVESGFRSQLTYSPVLYSEVTGKFIHFQRLLIQVGIGPVLTLLLLIYLGYCFLYEKTFLRGIDISRWKLVVFSLTTFLYSLSLTHVTRLFLEPLFATQFHIYLRTSLILFLLLLANDITKRRYVTTYIVAIWNVVLFACFKDIVLLISLYKFGFIFLVSATFEIYIRSRSIVKISSQEKLLAAFCFLLTLVQVADALFSFLFRVGEHLSIVMAIAIPLYLFSNLRLRSRYFKSLSEFSDLLTKLISEDTEIEDRTKKFGAWIKEFFSARSGSVYLDKFLLGTAQTPGVYFHGIYSDSKVANPDFSLDSMGFTDQNRWSISALLSQKPVIGSIIHDKSLFVCFPISNQVLYNLSIGIGSSLEEIYDKIQFLEDNGKLLKSFSQMISSHSSHHYETLRTLRSRLGDGEFVGDIFTVFIDINGYSTLVKRYGNSFTAFVEKNVFDKIAHDLRDIATVELKSGDELHLAIMPWTREKVTIEAASNRLLSYMVNFCKITLPSLCLEVGFEPVTVSAGIAYGSGVLRINDRFAGTSGSSVNMAKRMLQAAQRAEIVLDPSSYNLVKSTVHSDEIREIFVKNDIALGHVVALGQASNFSTGSIIENY